MLTFQTWATCVIFVLNMVLHPEIQQKARQELDAVVGHERLPEFSDRPSLPYIERIVQEVYRYAMAAVFEFFSVVLVLELTSSRWSPLAPLGKSPACPFCRLVQVLMQTIEPGIPHKSLEDDVYQGMFIPKGKF